MKRIFCLILFAALFLAPLVQARPVRASAAETDYAVASTQEVWFYSSPDESSGLFLLPKSYYVKIVEESAPFMKVEYGDGTAVPRIAGYCKRGSVTPVPFTPARPFLDKKVTLTYTLSGSFEGEFDSLEKTFSYLGSTFRGTARYWYVYADGQFGYVAAEGEPEYELNVDYLTNDTAGGSPESPDSPRSPLTGVQIALVCIAVCAALAVSAFVFFSRKTPPVRREESDDFV